MAVWRVSRFHAGDVVEVRSREEILATLDGTGAIEGLAFMPEMLQYCGRQFKVAAVAHKACDMVGTPGTSRRIDRTVHLVGLRCDGSAHGGCEAECNIFWKDDWLKQPGTSASTGRAQPPRCSGEQLEALTRATPAAGSAETIYACQATRMFEATQPLAWWDVRQYLYDITTKNNPAGHVFRVVFLAVLRATLRHTPFGYRLVKRFHDSMHRRLTGRSSPALSGRIPDGVPTPIGQLGLRVGELVRVKSQAEIEQTVDKNGRNRGLTFDPEEMAPYCGRTFKVRKSVHKIVDERNGRMITMKQPCIMLEGVVCKALYATCRLNCPREIPSYWRELWLERVVPEGPPKDAVTVRADAAPSRAETSTVQ